MEIQNWSVNVSATDNLDPDEISKFEAMAQKWWDPNSEFKPLPSICTHPVCKINWKGTLLLTC